MPSKKTPFGQRVLGTATLIGMTLLMLLLLSSPALAGYPDVPAGHPYAAAIDELSSHGVIGGYANGNFGLNDPVKRAQFAKMIVGALQIVPNTSTSTRFTDLGSPDTNGYPHVFVQTAYDNGITNGTNAAQTLFAPWNSIRRDQVVSMVVRGINSAQPGTLTDPPAGTTSLFSGVPEPHGQNLRIAEYNGLLDGLVGLGPDWSVTATATRGEVAQMLGNVLDLISGEEIWVYSDGSGDYATLEQAIAAAMAAGVGQPMSESIPIYIGSGTFTLTKTITIFDQSVNLIGSGDYGDDSTKITFGGALVDCDSGFFAAKDIDFECTAGNKDASVIVAQGSSEIHLEGCTMSGGTLDPGLGDHNKAGCGAYLGGTTTGTISDCLLMGNDVDGIALLDNVDVTLDHNQCNMNGFAGIGLYNRSEAVIESNVCYQNDYFGIAIGTRDSATATKNACKQNGLDGIWVGSADVVIENNDCSENVQNGIQATMEAIGDILNNKCSQNGLNGIRLGDYAVMTVEGNECTANSRMGICLLGDSVGELSGNTCNDNQMDGISVWDDAIANIVDNVCLRNNFSGIGFANSATGTVDSNTCSYSANADGITIADQAGVVVRDNTCENNTGAGVSFNGQSSGAAGGNECAYNKWGIYVAATANPVIETNDLHDNTLAQMYDERPV